MDMWVLDHCAATDLGRGRTNNEDFALLRPELQLFAVADGMGGHAAGEVASAVGSAALARAIADGEPLQRAVQQAHQAVLDAADSGQGSAAMGTTVVVLLAAEAEFEIAWVGDSRAYLYHAAAASLELISHDHSYVQSLYDAGLIDDQQLRHHPDRNLITQCLGAGAQSSLQVDIRRGHWSCGDIVLLCSDGLSDNVTADHLLELFQRHTGLTELSQALIEAALAANAQDNITAVLVSPRHAATDAATSVVAKSSNWRTQMRRIGQRLLGRQRSFTNKKSSVIHQ